MIHEVREFLKSKEKSKIFSYKNNKKNATMDFFVWSNLFSLLRYILFLIVRPLPIPPFYRWVYRLCGTKIGREVFFASDVLIDPFYPSLISIGDNCILGWGCRILAHEGYLRHFRLGRVKIGNNVVVGSFSTIRAGVTIGDNVIIAIGAVVDKDVPSNRVVGGIPEHEIKHITKIT